MPLGIFLMRKLGFLLVLLSLLWQSGCALGPEGAGDDHIVARAVLEDRAGDLTIEQAVNAEFGDTGNMLSKGYTDSVYWLRIVVRPRDAGGELLLRIRPTFIDQVTLYERNLAPASGWRQRVTGDQTPLMMRELASVSLGFTLQPAMPASTYYLRVKTSSTTIFHAQVLEPQVAAQKNTAQDLSQMLLVAFMLFMLLWAVCEFILSRQGMLAWYAINLCGQLFFALANGGYLAFLLPSPLAALNDTITNISVCLAAWLGLVFHRQLLTQFLANPMALRLIDGLILALPLTLVAIAAGWPRLALQANAWAILLAGPLVLFAAFSATQHRRMVRQVYALLAVVFFSSLVPLMGWSAGAEWTLHTAMIRAVITSGLIFLLVTLHVKRLRYETAQIESRYQLAQSELASERQQRDAQHRFMAMLNHELKTPMAVIRLVLGMAAPSVAAQRHAQQSIADLDAVVERCLQVDQLEQRQTAPQRQACRVDDMLAQLCDSQATPQRLVLRAEALPSVWTDHTLLQIALRNLIDNAVKYADAQQPIHVEAYEFEHLQVRGVMVSIANTPASAELPDPQRLFEKYYRGPNAHARTGSGLGLYIVRGSLQQLGGWVRYAPSAGVVRFDSWIPC